MRFPGKHRHVTALVVVLLAAFLGLCVGDVAQALTAPNAEASHCASGGCDAQMACNVAPTSSTIAPSVAVLTPVHVFAVPTVMITLAVEPEPPACRDPQVVPRAPRSPPLI